MLGIGILVIHGLNEYLLRSKSKTENQVDEDIKESQTISQKSRRTLKSGINLQIPKIIISDDCSSSDWNEHRFHTPQPYKTPQPVVQSSGRFCT